MQATLNIKSINLNHSFATTNNLTITPEILITTSSTQTSPHNSPATTNINLKHGAPSLQSPTIHQKILREKPKESLPYTTSTTLPCNNENSSHLDNASHYCRAMQSQTRQQMQAQCYCNRNSNTRRQTNYKLN